MLVFYVTMFIVGTNKGEQTMKLTIENLPIVADVLCKQYYCDTCYDDIVTIAIDQDAQIHVDQLNDLGVTVEHGCLLCESCLDNVQYEGRF